MNNETIQQMNDEHNTWLRSLKFYKNEIGLLKNKLTEMCSHKSGRDAAVNLEHFENQFTIQEKNIHTLDHNIKEVLQQTSARPEPAHSYQEIAQKHELLRDKFIQEERIINELRNEFTRFAGMA